MPQLTEIKIRSIKPDGKIRRFYDQHGLYLETSKAGGKYWRWRYRFDGKEKRLSLGAWPDVSLKEAREKRDDYRRVLKEGSDPAPVKKGAPCKDETTFRAIGESWRQNMSNIWSASHAETVKDRLERDAYPVLGSLPIDEIDAQTILAMIRKIEARGAYETASRVLGVCSMIFRYGVAIGRVKTDPCRDLRGALVPHQKKSFAALTKPKDVAALMLAIDAYEGSAVVRAALRFSALTFCRPGEIRHAEWQEIDMEKRLWTIPAAKMKMRTEHQVPLSLQAHRVLEELRPLTRDGRYVFPTPRAKSRPLSENAVNVAIRIMGFTKDQMTAHGFRSMASTLLNELGHRPDVIEAQLAHKGADKIRAIYNRAQYMEERRTLMQAWADYLDELVHRE